MARPRATSPSPLQVLPQLWSRAVARDFSDVNSEVDWHQRAFGAMKDCFHVTGFPPNRLLRQQVVRERALALRIRRIGDFFVPAEDDHARPLLRAHHFVGLNADERVGPHPLDLPSKRRKAIEVFVVVGKIKWHNVWLAALRATQSAKPRASEQLETFFGSEFLDQKYFTRLNHRVCRQYFIRPDLTLSMTQALHVGD
jgi:LmbE family N-acetylglucosaminyl deacetylase